MNVQFIIKTKQVTGVDVCGELPVSPVEQFQAYFQGCNTKERKKQFANPMYVVSFLNLIEKSKAVGTTDCLF